ncbi:MAG: NUDIX hydrolase [Anaerolineales bacterium]|nr:NUDIX hydrolase [Anaerolineales bacterium]
MPKQSVQEQVIEAAGGLLWRLGARGRQLALIHRQRYDDWSLPKGKREPGETWQETALREVLEETGCQAELLGFIGGTTYTVKGGPKVVLFWSMRVAEDCELQENAEVDAFQWVSPEQALEILSYASERQLVRQWLEQSE